MDRVLTTSRRGIITLFNWQRVVVILIEILTLYNTNTELNIQQALSGMVLVPRRKKKYAELDEKIFNALGYYGRVDNEMNC